MKLAVSQLGWQQDQLEQALVILKKNDFSGLEILPTMVVGENPYTKIHEAVHFAEKVWDTYGLEICSMQSIWYGQTGNLFVADDQQKLLAYTKEAILFAKEIKAKNLVFGSPKNRNMPQGADENTAVSFFKEVGEFAYHNQTFFSLEANPPIYGTNYMNTTMQALETAKKVGNSGCKVNLDVGTMLTNQEPIEELRGHVAEIHHVHISEPELAMIQPRTFHKELAELLRAENYAGFVSIEMKPQTLENLEKAVTYVAEVFG